MRRVRINIHSLRPDIAEAFLFDIKDRYTLRLVGEAFKVAVPGKYKIVEWVDPFEVDLHKAFEVFVEFSEDDEMIEWVLKNG